MKKKVFLFFALVSAFAAECAHAQVFIGTFEAIEKCDTMLVGIFRQEVTERYNALMDEWNAMKEKELQSEAIRRNSEDLQKYTPSAADEEIAKLERQRAAALKEIDKLAGMLPADQVAQTRKSVNDSFDDMIAALPETYSGMSSQMREQNASLVAHDPSEFSNDKKYALKRRFAALAVDGVLHGYHYIRPFRHDRAAVCRQTYSPANGITLRSWGFVDHNGREVVPCRYFKVFDFNNVSNSAGVFESHEDADSQGWTTVWEDGTLLGMVDRDGRVRIPCKFAAREIHSRIVFFGTPWGEFAPVCDGTTMLYGIIDRNGNYTMRPSVEHNILWYADVECFGYRTEEGELVTFDAYGKRMNNE